MKTDQQGNENSAVAKVFDDASSAVLDDRGETHGSINDNFGQTAEFWSSLLSLRYIFIMPTQPADSDSSRLSSRCSVIH